MGSSGRLAEVAVVVGIILVLCLLTLSVRLVITAVQGEPARETVDDGKDRRWGRNNYWMNDEQIDAINGIHKERPAPTGE